MITLGEKQMGKMKSQIGLDEYQIKIDEYTSNVDWANIGNVTINTTAGSNGSFSSGKIFTIGPDNPIKIRHYADMIAGLMGWNGVINWDTKPRRPGEIYWLNSDHKLITKTLGWQPKVALKDGLQMTIDFWQNKLCK